MRDSEANALDLKKGDRRRCLTAARSLGPQKWYEYYGDVVVLLHEASKKHAAGCKKQAARTMQQDVSVDECGVRR